VPLLIVAGIPLVGVPVHWVQDGPVQVMYDSVTVVLAE
jgi:hypothetical protein